MHSPEGLVTEFFIQIPKTPNAAMLESATMLYTQPRNESYDHTCPLSEIQELVTSPKNITIHGRTLPTLATTLGSRPRCCRPHHFKCATGCPANPGQQPPLLPPTSFFSFNFFFKLSIIFHIDLPSLFSFYVYSMHQKR